MKRLLSPILRPLWYTPSTMPRNARTGRMSCPPKRWGV